MTRTERRLLKAADAALLYAMPAPKQPQMTVFIQAVGDAARGSILWIGLSVPMVFSPSKRHRRAAVQGLASIIASTAGAHLVKVASRRRRPPRQLFRYTKLKPSSYSFPSSHSASAAAFVTAVTLELPAMGPFLATASLLVGYSRVQSRMHFPVDVLGGWMLGAPVGWLVHKRTGAN